MIITAIANLYLMHKEHLSVTTHKNTPRSPLPVLGRAPNGNPPPSLVQAVNSQLSKLKYRMDPLNGTLDFYNPAEYTQWQLENQRWDQPCDCDDYAAYALGLFRAAGVAEHRVWLWTLVIDWTELTTKMWANHVLCGVELVDGNGQTWTGVLDTNSSGQRAAPFWFKGAADAAGEQVKAEFGRIYGVNYSYLFKSKYPWRI